MKIEKRGSGQYRVRKTINKKTYTVTFDHQPSKKEIDIAFIEHMSTSSIYAPSGEFEIYAYKYLAIKDKVLSASTVRGYKSIINNMPQWFLNMPLKNITREDVQKLINDYSAEHSPKSTRNLHGFIAAVLRMYYPDLVLNTTLPQKKDYEGYVPTPDEVRAILDAAYGTKYWIPFKLGTYSLRRSEIIALKYPDDFDGRIIHVTKALVQDDTGEWILKSTKTTGSTRDVVVSQEMIDVIKDQGCVYEGSAEVILQNLHRYQDRLSIPHFRFHDLRAYFATEMSKILPEQDWLAMGGWSSDHVAKKVYRKSRIEQNKQIQLDASDKLESL